MLMVRAYAHHASRTKLAALGCVTAALAMFGIVRGIARLDDSLVSAVVLLATGAGTLALLFSAMRRVRTPLGGLRIAPGDLLPSLPAHALDGPDVDASTLRGPRGALLVWYRGLT